MTDTEKAIEGEGSYEYLARALAIATLLYERGILQELLDSGRITLDEIELRLGLIRERYSIFSSDNSADPAAESETIDESELEME